MRYLKWIAAVALAFAAGWLVVSYLTTTPRQMSAYLAAACFALAGAIAVVASGFRGRQLALAIVAGVVALAAGYAINTTVVLGREDTRKLPEITRKAGDPGKGFTAVVYFTHGEPETFNPIGWLNQFREFDEQGVPFIPFLARPFFIYELRNAYLEVGTSRHRQVHYQMGKRLEEKLHAEGMRDARVYVSFLDDDPRPNAAVIKALNDGASRIIVSEVFLTSSNHNLEGENQIKELDVDKLGVPLAFTKPLWDSETMYEMFLAKAEAARGSMDKEKVGVLLVGHGQPDEWDREFPTETSQELGFRTRILDRLAERGYPAQNLGSAWMSFKEPLPAEKAEAIAAAGAKKIFYFSSAISADSIHSQYDIPELVEEAELPPDVQLVNLGAWNDHPLTIRAISERILAAGRSLPMASGEATVTP